MLRCGWLGAFGATRLRCLSDWRAPAAGWGCGQDEAARGVCKPTPCTPPRASLRGTPPAPSRACAAARHGQHARRSAPNTLRPPAPGRQPIAAAAAAPRAPAGEPSCSATAAIAASSAASAPGSSARAEEKARRREEARGHTGLPDPHEPAPARQPAWAPAGPHIGRPPSHRSGSGPAPSRAPPRNAPPTALP
jgi:hypothetical protein